MTADTLKSRGSHWQPLFDHADQDRVRAVIQMIEVALREELSRGVSSPDLGNGLSGMALFFGTLAECTGDRSTHSIACECLRQATDLLEVTPLGPGLYAGFTGVAWTAAHLDPDASAEMFSTVDDALLAHLSSHPWRSGFDLISGLVGIGVYFLERLPDSRASAGLDEILSRLDESAEHTDCGITWKTRRELVPEHQRSDGADGYYNLGVAHGVPGVISFLGSCCTHQQLEPRSRPLLEGAVNWLYKQRMPAGCDSVFPFWDDTIESPSPARTAWCYGDPGVATALLVAAEGADVSEWKNFAVEIAKQALHRPFENTEVVDAPLCHGAAGLGHLYNRFWNVTGEEIFREAAIDWFRVTLDLQTSQNSLAGFPAWKTTPEGLGWVDEPGFLEGAAGIGLALLSAVSDQPPRWDRPLLTCIDSDEQETTP
ncbi:MAG: lanthionine synthetase C family protein [Planctomycetaceae bacterium]